MQTNYDFTVDKKWNETLFHEPFWLPHQAEGGFTHALHSMGFKMSLWLCCDYDVSEYEEHLLGAPASKAAEGPDNQPLADDLIKNPHFNPQHLDRLTRPSVPWFEHLKKFVDAGADAFKMDGSNQVCFHPDRSHCADDAQAVVCWACGNG